MEVAEKSLFPHRRVWEVAEKSFFPHRPPLPSQGLFAVEFENGRLLCCRLVVGGFWGGGLFKLSVHRRWSDRNADHNVYDITRTYPQPAYCVCHHHPTLSVIAIQLIATSSDRCRSDVDAVNIYSSPSQPSQHPHPTPAHSPTPLYVSNPTSTPQSNHNQLVHTHPLPTPHNPLTHTIIRPQLPPTNHPETALPHNSHLTIPYSHNPH